MSTRFRKTDREPWGARRDSILMDLVSQGCTMQQVADHLRVSRNAIVGRFNRLRQRMGWQAS